MLEKFLTVAATLPKDAAAAALVGRVDRPRLGPSVVRVNPDATLTDITSAFPTVSQLCNQPDPAAALRAAEGMKSIGNLADVLTSRRLARTDRSSDRQSRWRHVSRFDDRTHDRRSAARRHVEFLEAFGSHRQDQGFGRQHFRADARHAGGPETFGIPDGRQRTEPFRNLSAGGPRP